ncbi:MAG: PilZ domain-containing protein [Deltaproteobacteria bacterium]|nr:PilZ domain-containing protein [Deltaproteobacteria bacterium]MBW2122400.1 PilZ domain-containing protein [Deltaproteobacteria bacterium]
MRNVADINQRAGARLDLAYRDVERRRFFRIKGAVPVFYRLVDVKGAELSRLLTGETRDFSRQGICLQTHVLIVDGVDIFARAMEPDRRLSLAIELPTTNERIRATGRVIWQEDTRSWFSPKPFSAGIFLVEMDDRDWKGWHEFIDSIV